MRKSKPGGREDSVTQGPVTREPMLTMQTIHAPDGTHRILLAHYHDFVSRSRALDDYERIKASGLLRQLLLDSHSLVDRVNREQRLRLVFRMKAARKLPIDEIPYSTTSTQP